ncbi:amidohydrolase family protein [Microbispora sp. RL4-1S]|uniref:Amidohydrolase family protein n=1 Tax=Microbispora oryzae TaxID=2806554 RepID=A0A941AL18_9ACTN|nr:amidohydrolase family protein [Microbispora oryzae]MBP2706737.1 amidohydrolase family protein [Microbispora oryzae]
MDLLIKGGHLASGQRADILVDDGEIISVGSAPGAEAAEVIDADGLVVVPGFVDGHRHVWQAPLRGIGPDMTLPEYMTAVLGRALNGYGPREAHHATLLGAAEALNAGITTVFDWSNATRTPEHTDAVLDAYATAGIRAVVAHANPDDERDVRRMADLRGRITGALAILGTDYGPWDEAVRQIELGRRLGLVVSMHAGGGPGSPLRRMGEAGLLGPHLQLVHVNNMTGDDAELLADNGVGVTVTPIVEATMGHGASAFSRFADAGGRAGLGTDVVVNAPADLFEPMRDTLRSHRAHTGTMHPAGGILAAATVDSARAIGIDDAVGTISAGKRADLVLLDGLSHLLGTGDVAGAVVTSLGPADVHTVVVDGRVVKRDGLLVGLDLARLRRSTAEAAVPYIAGLTSPV